MHRDRRAQRRPFDRGLEHSWNRSSQVGGDDAYVSLAQLARVSDDCRDVVTGGKRLLEDVPTDASTRREDCEPHSAMKTTQGL